MNRRATTQPVAHFLSGLYEMSAKGARYPAMEGIRGLAVFLVFFVHFNQQYAQHLPAQDLTTKFFVWAGTVGHAGVDLFFLLSGYLIYGVVRAGRKSIPEFLSRRIWRIYPTFLAIFILYLLIMWLQPGTSKIPDRFGDAALYLLQNVLLLPGLFSITPIITVAWSLSYEIFYYAALPLLYWICRMRQWTAASRIAFFACLTLAYCVFCAKWWTLSIPALALFPAQHVRLIMFAVGILVYEALSSGVPRWLNRTFEWATSFAVCISFVTIPAIGTIPVTRGFKYAEVVQATMLFVAFSGLALCCLGRPKGALGRAFSWTPLRWLGNMSYSYYLSHALVLHVVFSAASRGSWYHSPPVAWILAVICFALTWVGATLLFACVEKPLSFTAKTQSQKIAPTQTQAASDGPSPATTLVKGTGIGA